MAQTILMDGAFEKLKDKVQNAIINTNTANEHVGEIEHSIQTIKESTRGTINTLPFKALPKLMIAHLLHFVVMWVNALLVASWVSKR